MTQQNGFVMNFTKKYDIGHIFDFVESESHDGGVLYTNITWLFISIFNFYFCSCFGFEFIHSNKKKFHHNNLSSVTVTWGGATKYLALLQQSK